MDGFHGFVVRSLIVSALFSAAVLVDAVARELAQARHP